MDRKPYRSPAPQPATSNQQPATSTPATSDDLATWNVVVGRVSGRWDQANLKIQPFSDVPGRFEAGARLCAVTAGRAQHPARRQLLEVRAARRTGHSWILDCDLVSPEAAEALRGAQLFIHPSLRPQLAPGEFYFDQLLGLRVRTQSGQDLGEIEEVLETPAHPVYVTARAMIPGLAAFVVETDFEQRTMTVRDVPGLRTDE